MRPNWGLDPRKEAISKTWGYEVTIASVPGEEPQVALRATSLPVAVPTTVLNHNARGGRPSYGDPNVGFALGLGRVVTALIKGQLVPQIASPHIN